MSDSPLVLGGDGGGTKTLGLVSDSKGTILARQQVGATNPNVVGLETSAKNVSQLISLCCKDARCKPEDLGAIVLGLAGAGSDAERERLVYAVNAHLMKSGVQALRIGIETDVRIALEGAFGGGHGVVVIAGTGSNVLGKTSQGNVLGVGGWGRVLGDEGSGYYIGCEALKAVARDFDKRGDSGTLRHTLVSKYGWDTRERIIAAVYRENFAIPSLAPLVLEAAHNNDTVCLGILQNAATLLAEQVHAAVREIGIQESIGVVMCGGLIDHDTVYAALLGREVLRLCPHAEIRPAMYPPVHGAVLMALDRLKET